jgi:hypothetical protein
MASAPLKYEQLLCNFIMPCDGHNCKLYSTVDFYTSFVAQGAKITDFLSGEFQFFNFFSKNDFFLNRSKT